MATFITQIKKPEVSRGILIIGIFSLLAVGSWIGFDLYRALVKSTLPQLLQSQLQPLQTEVDDQLIQNLRSRHQYDDIGLGQVQSVASEVPTGTPTPGIARLPISLTTPTPVSSSSGTTATTSGKIKL